MTGDVDAPLALCSAGGQLEALAPAACSLLQRMRVQLNTRTSLPQALWCALRAAPIGEPVLWQPLDGDGSSLECTRYPASRGGFLLWLREARSLRVSESENCLALRQAATGRLLASVAHDVRSPVARIVYSADFLDARGAGVQRETLRETVHEICDAGHRLQLTVDGLLDYARLGPAIASALPLQDLLNRAQSLLRSFYGDGAPRLRVALADGADRLRGNAVVVEQVFVNLMLCFADAAEVSSLVEISAATAADAGYVQVQLSGRRPVIARLQEFTTPASALRAPAARMALLDARAAVESQGGQLQVDETGQNLRFIVELPRAEGPR